MWNDIIIGTRNKVNGIHYLASAVKVFNINLHNISENHEEYWINHCILDTGMVVCKDTKEGQLITQMIKDNTKAKTFQKKLDQMILNQMTVSIIYVGILKIQNEYFDKGVEANQKEMQKALGLRGKSLRLSPEM